MSDALDQVLEDLHPFRKSFGLSLDKIAAGDAVTTVEYMGAAMGEAWHAFPADMRSKAVDGLRIAVANVVEAIGEGAEELADALDALNAIGDSAGPIVDLVITVIATGFQIGKTIKAGKRATSQHSRAFARRKYANANYGGPAFWAMRALPMNGYAEYVPDRSNAVNWSWVPCFPLDQGESKIYGVNMDAPKGKWGRHNGVGLKCPTFREAGPWDGCEVVGTVGDKFSGAMWTNALAYPYWSPSLPPKPIATDSIEFPKGTVTVIDPNEPIIRHQMLLLSDPYTNFQLNQGAVKLYTSRFVKWWQSYLEFYFCGRINEDGRSVGPYESKLTPDPQKLDNTGSSTAKRFYFDDDGMIRVYDAFKTGSNKVDLADYGASIHTGGAGLNMGCSFASYNAVVSSSAAFLTARAEFLRNGARCQGFEEDAEAGVIDFEDFDHEIRDAIRASAKRYRDGPAPQLGKAPPPPPPRAKPKRQSTRPSRSPTMGAGVGVWLDAGKAEERAETVTTGLAVLAVSAGIGAATLGGVMLYNRKAKRKRK